MTKHFAIPSLVGQFSSGAAQCTKIRKHAPEDGKGCGRLLVELIKGRPGETLEVFERTGCRARHGELGDTSDLREGLEPWS